MAKQQEIKPGWWLVIPAVAWMIFGFWPALFILMACLVVAAVIQQDKTNAERLERQLGRLVRPEPVTREPVAPLPSALPPEPRVRSAPAKEAPVVREKPAAVVRPPAPPSAAPEAPPLAAPATGRFEFAPTCIETTHTIAAPSDGLHEFDRVLAQLQAKHR